MALTGLRFTHAVCTHVERLLDPENLMNTQ
jgi:hypothetical protein